MILNEDAQTPHERHMDLLRQQLADERRSRADADDLTYKYAGVIGEYKEQTRVAETAAGIARNIRRLHPESISLDELRAIVAALCGVSVGMSHYGQDTDEVTERLDAAHDAADNARDSDFSGLDVTEAA